MKYFRIMALGMIKWSFHKLEKCPWFRDMWPLDPARRKILASSSTDLKSMKFQIAFLTNKENCHYIIQLSYPLTMKTISSGEGF
ncbi:MAG: hypothetical protein CMK07_03700 [Ponticaulis sp.]|nr:hypothetical protein [Ponticaulis sp.]